MIHSQEYRKLVYSRSLHSAMNRKKSGLLCKDYWQPLSAKPTANHGDLSAVPWWYPFFDPSMWVLRAFFAAATHHLKINVLHKSPINNRNFLIFTP